MAAVVLILLIGGGAVALAARRLPPALQRLVALAYFAHLLAAAAQVWMHLEYYGGGDMITYMKNAAPIARLLEIDFGRWFPQLVRLWLHMDSELPYVHGAGGTSGTMVGLAAFAVYLFDKPIPVWEVCLAVSTTSMLGQIWLCKALVAVLEPKVHVSAAAGVLLVPSVVFWSSALLKEAITLPFLALLLLSSVAFARGRYVVGSLGIVLGAGGVGLIKGYLLMPYVISIAAAAYVSNNAAPGRRRVRWPYAIAGFIIAVLGIATISALFPEYSPGSIAENTARYQQTYETLENMGQGGSNIDLGDVKDVTLLGQLRYVPLAAVNALFRPMFFEARSIVTFAASLETLVIVVLLLRLLRNGIRRPLAQVMASPALAFSAVFVFTFSIAVGLSTLNLGTLSRYRIPMMPFFSVLLFVLGRTERATQPARPPVRAVRRHAAHKHPLAVQRRRA